MSGWGARNKIRHTARTRGTAHWFMAGMVVAASLLDACGADTVGDPRGAGLCIPDCNDRLSGTCSSGESCNPISGLCVAPVGLIWTDSIQSGGRQYGFDGFETEHPVGNPVAPGDSNGVNLSRVPDPLGGPGYAMRQYGVYHQGGARSELGIWSFNQQAFRDLALSGEPIYVAQEIYFPEAVDAGGDGWAWLALLDWHTTKDGGNRWDTSLGMMVKQDGSMRFRFARRNVNDNSNWSTNGQLALEQTGVTSGRDLIDPPECVLAADPSHNVLLLHLNR